jgi:hypothetical protein
VLGEHEPDLVRQVKGDTEVAQSGQHENEVECYSDDTGTCTANPIVESM